MSDLTYRNLETGDDDAGLTVTRRKADLGRKRSRYDAPWVGETLPAILDTMALTEVDLIRIKPGEWGGSHGTGMLTEIRPGGALLSALAGLRLEDFGLSMLQEIVMLRGKKVGRDRGDLQDYADDATTEAMRADVRRINDWLSEADIGLAPVPAADRIDTSFRRLRRCFTCASFTSGGRLFGGFWQQMSKAERRAIRIDGEAAVTLDYGQIGPRILYGMAGHELLTGDAYWLPILSGSHRAGVKKIMAAATFAKKRLKQWPKGARELFPEGTSLTIILTAIELQHPAIASLLYRGVGHKVQHIESVIMMDVLARMRRSGIVGLPIHDAVVCRQDKAQATRRIMIEAFEAATGLGIAVDLE